MTTRERIALLAPVVAQFPEMGAFGDEGALCDLIRLELGSENSLETGAVLAPGHILHIISSNTAMAGIQSLVRGLILGSMNWCKTPQAGLPRFEEFVSLLPEPLHALVELSEVLPQKWLEGADAVVVFGTDDTVEKFRVQIKPDRIFAGYGNRWSGAVIYSDADYLSIPSVVRDACSYEQMGCLSAQIVWLHDSIDAVAYGERFAAELERYVTSYPPLPLPADAVSSVGRWRATAEWDAIADGKVWLSRGEPVWGVSLTKTARLSCLHRHVTLVPFEDVPDLGDLSNSVSSLGLWPDIAENRKQLASSGASRFCEVGELQFPVPTWQQDGFPALGRLTRVQR